MMRRILGLCLLSCVLLAAGSVPTLAGDADLQAAGVGEGITVSTIFLLDDKAALDQIDEIVMSRLVQTGADDAASMTLKWINMGFVWRLRVCATPGMLPSAYVKGVDGDGNEYLEISQTEAAQALPRRGHRYMASMSYDPVSNLVSVSVFDSTEGSEVYSTHFALESTLESDGLPLSDGISHEQIEMVSAGLTLLETSVDAHSNRYGLPLALKRDFRWDLVQVTGDLEKINYPFRPKPFKSRELDYFSLRDDLGLYLSWPKGGLNGRIQVILSGAGVDTVLHEVAWTGQGETVVPLPLEAVRPGLNELTLIFESDGYRSVIGGLALSAKIGKLYARVTAEDSRLATGSDTLSAILEYRFDGASGVKGDQDLLSQLAECSASLVARYSIKGYGEVEAIVWTHDLNLASQSSGRIEFTFEIPIGSTEPDFSVEFAVPGGVDVDAAAKVVNVSPSVFWASDPVQPGETVLLRGGNFTRLEELVAVELVRLEDDEPDAVLFIPQTSPSGSSPESIRADRTVAFEWPDNAQRYRLDVMHPGDQSAKFILPEELDLGIYAVRTLGDGGSTGPAVLLNEPDLWWVQGDAGLEATPGGWLRLFGTSLAVSDRTPRVAIERIGADGSVGELSDLAVEVIDEFSLKVALPADLELGEYLVYVHNGYGGNCAWSIPERVVVKESQLWPQTVYNVRDFGATGKGTVDDTQAFRAALQRAAENGGGIVYVPRGRYRLTGALQIPEYTVLRGESRETATVFWLDFATEAPPAELIRGNTYFAIEDITFYAERYLHFITGNGNVRIQRLTVRANTYKGLPSYEEMDKRFRETMHLSAGSPAHNSFLLKLFGPNIQIIDNDMLGSASGLWLESASGAFVSGNTIRLGRKGKNGTVDCSHLIFEDNVVMGADLMSAEGIHYTWSHEYSYTARNVFTGLYGNHREAFSTDGGGGSYYTSILRADRTSFTVSDLGGVPPRAAVYVLSGAGAGQVRLITGVEQDSGDRVVVDRPWDVVPDESSTVAITAVRRNMIFVDNALTDTGHFQFYGTAVEAIVKGNSATRSGGFWQAGQTTGGVTIQPTWYVQWLENEIIEGNYIHWDGNDQWSGPAMFGVYARIRPEFGDDVAVIGSILRGNHIHNGGIIRTSTGNHSSPVVVDVIIENNIVENTDVGISINGAVSSVLVRENSFSNVTKEIEAPIYLDIYGKGVGR